MSKSMIESSLLDCGIRLVTERMASSRSVSVGFWVGSGSRDETDEQAGVCHFLEHLLFKGTPTRNARQIAEQIDAVGGDMNAFTTKEYTTFYVRSLAEHLDLGLDILSDIIWHPALREDEVDSERQVILEEALMHLDEPGDVAQEHFYQAIFPNHPLGREVLGMPEVIRSLEVPVIRAFLAEHFGASNIVVAAAGDVDHESIASAIETRFSGVRGVKETARVAPGPGLRRLDVTTRDSEQAQLVLGVRGVDRYSPKRFALSLLNHSLGGGLSSRLFQKIREERGLAYSIVSERVSYADAGALEVSVGCTPDHAKEVLDLVQDELDSVASSGVSEREVALAKGYMKADTLLSLEDSGARMSRIGASLLLHGEVLEVDELLARVEAVTCEQVCEVAAELLNSQRVLAVVGPFSEEDFESSLR